MKVDVVYTEEWRRKATIDVDEDALRNWLGTDPMGDGPPRRWTGDISSGALALWLNETWHDRSWAINRPPDPATDEFLDVDIESAQSHCGPA